MFTHREKCLLFRIPECFVERHLNVRYYRCARQIIYYKEWKRKGLFEVILKSHFKNF